MTPDLQALQDADFGWVQSLESIWSDDQVADAGPNQGIVDALITQLAPLTKSPNPPGHVLLGQAGIGKTHLMGVLRRRAWAQRCWFVMLDVVGITDFWKSAALSFVTSLLQAMPDGRRQYEAVIGGIARRFNIEEQVNTAFDSPTIETKKIVDLLVGGLIKIDPANALRHRDVFRALALLRSHDLAAVGIAHAWLQGYDADETWRGSLGFLTPPPAPVEIVRGLLWVMALAGPTLVAVDQIDGVLSIGRGAADFGETIDFRRLLTAGLLDLMTAINRGMVVVTCLLSSWEVIRAEGPAPLLQRFVAPTPLKTAQSESFVRTLIADRLAPAFAKAGLSPQSATWPFTEMAIRSAAGLTPRTIFMRCDDHRKHCLALGKIAPCDSLAGPGERPPTISQDTDKGFDATFASATSTADLTGLIDDRDDGKLGNLLRDAFDLYARQIDPHEDYDVVTKADAVQKTPPLHGRLTFVDHRANDAERHYCFRALQHSNGVALCARFKAALTASGIAASIPHRHLVIVRRGPPPSGKKTKELFDAFAAAGGLVVDPGDADLRSLVALRRMRETALAESRYDAFERWLVARKPLCELAMFDAAGLCPPPLPIHGGARATSGLPDVAPALKSEQFHPSGIAKRFQLNGYCSRATSGLPDAAPALKSEQFHPSGTANRFQLNGYCSCGATGEAERSNGADRAAGPATSVDADPPALPVGHRSAGGDSVDLATALLPRHTAIIAGAGSGKTVLLRRMVEEAALAGIPAIVIDPNNDLSRLGDPWPERPAAFTDEDAAKAARYATTVEVVVWTPGIQAGNPLFLSVLPDFAAIGDDPDERAHAVGMAAETLGPLAGAKTSLQKGVLADAIRAFAHKGGGDLKAITTLLADLPEGASDIDDAGKLAARMANELKAAVSTNPLLKATGPVLDPRLLFYGRQAGRTRVSVVNLSGLASEEAKQDFVNRLQMTLFGWVKKNPAPRGLLYVIDEAQLFIPSAGGALSKSSGVQLVAQARKYGLGMILATQAPKGIDNKVISNCTTQFLGKQNAPTDQQSVKTMVAATGGAADDIGRLAMGEFYFKTEKSGRPFKVRTSICLSHHPANPPSPDEVVLRARASAAKT